MVMLTRIPRLHNALIQVCKRGLSSPAKRKITTHYTVVDRATDDRWAGEWRITDAISELLRDLQRIYDRALINNLKRKVQHLYDKAIKLKAGASRKKAVDKFKSELDDTFQIFKNASVSLVSKRDGESSNQVICVDPEFSSDITLKEPETTSYSQEVISRGTELETELSQDITPTETKTISNFNSKVLFYEGTMSSCETTVDPRDVNDQDYELPQVTVSDLPLFKNNGSLPHTVLSMLKYGTAPEEAAHLLQGFTADLFKNGIVDKLISTTASKLIAERKKQGSTLIANLSLIDLLGLYFDGKDDHNVWTMNPNGTWNISKRSNVSLVQQPGGKQIGFVSIEKGEGTGKGVAQAILNFLALHKIDESQLICLGGDGCAVNLGPWNGVFAEIERIKKRPFQRVTCMLHHCELPMRALFIFFDGPRTGPESFSGIVGNLILGEVHLSPLREFKRIPVEFPRVSAEVLARLSTDSKRMYELCVGVVDGNLEKVKHLKLGKTSGARWITFGARLIRLYVSQEYNRLSALQQEILDRMTLFIVGVYYKVFVSIKHKPSMVEAPKHLFNEISLARDLCTDAEFKIVSKSIQINASMGHPEAVMIAMCGDGDDTKRLKVFNLLKDLAVLEQYRAYVEEQSGVIRANKGKVRPYELPALNFKARDYFGLCFFKAEIIQGSESVWGSRVKRWLFKTFTPGANQPYGWSEVTMAPLLMTMSEGERESIKQAPLVLDYPCHTQAVEFAVANTSKSVSQFKTGQNQLAGTLLTQEAREKILNKRVTHSRFLEDISAMTSSALADRSFMSLELDSEK